MALPVPTEVSGIITDIDYKNKWLTLTHPKTKKVIKCTWNLKRFDVRRGDALYGCFLKDSDDEYFIKDMPFVQLAVDPKSLISTICSKMTNKNYKKAVSIFNTLSEEAGGESKVSAYLTELASVWEKSRKEINLGTELVGEKGFTAFLSFWYQNSNLRRVLCLGVSEELVKESLLSCDELYRKLIKNPYTVACIPMELCSSIKKQVGIKLDVEELEKGVIVRVVYSAMKNSAWACTPISYLERKHPNWSKHQASLEADYDLVLDKEYESIYLKHPLRIEEFVAETLKKYAKADKITYDTPVTPFKQFRYGDLRCAVETTRNFSVDQIAAIQGGVDHTLCVITGGAGTGKTSCLAEIVNNLENRGIGYALCSFTGKAVARIKEVAKNANSYTIHRLLEMAKGENERTIEHLIIDEVSMVTTKLFYDLFTVYDKIKKITLIGDINQLQPIGWGSLFFEAVKSCTIPTYRLTTNYRIYIDGDERDGIIMNANALLDHDEDYGTFRYQPTSNFFVMEGGAKEVRDLVSIFAKQGIPSKNLVTLCPYTAKGNGETELNQISLHYQKTYDKGEIFHVDSRGVKWKEGDVVMLKKNNAEIGVFNGEMGSIQEIRSNNMLVDFGTAGTHEFLYEPTKKIHRYKDDTEDDVYSERTALSLVHGYVLTVNKSQGSEWDFVILYVPYICQGDFINRNLIYTAITRAKRAVYIVAQDVKQLEIHSTKTPSLRQENLALRLSADLDYVGEYRNKELCENAYMTS
jgi:hypothetical protein